MSCHKAKLYSVIIIFLENWGSFIGWSILDLKERYGQIN